MFFDVFFYTNGELGPNLCEVKYSSRPQYEVDRFRHKSLGFITYTLSNIGSKPLIGVYIPVIEHCLSRNSHTYGQFRVLIILSLKSRTVKHTFFGISPVILGFYSLLRSLGEM